MTIRRFIFSSFLALISTVALLLPSESISSGFSLLQMLAEMPTPTPQATQVDSSLEHNAILILLASTIIGFIGFTRRKSILVDND